MDFFQVIIVNTLVVWKLSLIDVGCTMYVPTQ